MQLPEIMHCHEKSTDIWIVLRTVKYYAPLCRCIDSLGSCKRLEFRIYPGDYNAGCKLKLCYYHCLCQSQNFQDFFCVSFITHLYHLPHCMQLPEIMHCHEKSTDIWIVLRTVKYYAPLCRCIDSRGSCKSKVSHVLTVEKSSKKSSKTVFYLWKNLITTVISLRMNDIFF